MEGKKRRGRCK